MELNQGRVAAGLVEEVLRVIHQYDESLYLPTVLGCLDLVKHQIILEHQEEDNE